jgi:uncharacterized protein
MSIRSFWLLPNPRVLLAAVLSISVLMGCASLDTKQGQWIFNPTDRTWGDTAQVASGMQDVWIEYDSQLTGKSVKLHAVVSPATRPALAAAVAEGPRSYVQRVNAHTPDAHTDTHPSQAPVLLYLHGARWNVTGSAYRIQRMQELGFTVVAVDYRGFGKTSTETPSEKMAYEDALATWQWLAKTYPHQPRYIFGHSLGGAIAIELASKVDDEKGTIVEGTFTSIPDVAATMAWGWLPVRPFISQRFESVKKVAKIGSPLLVVHGSNDTLIKPALGRQLFEAAAEPKKFVLVEGGSHHNTNAVGQAAYRVALAEMFGIPHMLPAIEPNTLSIK